MKCRVSKPISFRSRNKWWNPDCPTNTDESLLQTTMCHQSSKYHEKQCDVRDPTSNEWNSKLFFQTAKRRPLLSDYQRERLYHKLAFAIFARLVTPHCISQHYLYITSVHSTPYLATLFAKLYHLLRPYSFFLHQPNLQEWRHSDVMDCLDVIVSLRSK